MTTTDNNGIVYLEQTDPVEPLEAAINLVAASISQRFDEDMSTHLVANLAERTTLQNTLQPSITNPLLIWRQDLGEFEINKGSGWTKWPTAGEITVRGTKSSARNIPPNGYETFNPKFGVTFTELPFVETQVYGSRLVASVHPNHLTNTGCRIVLHNVSSQTQQADSCGFFWRATGKVANT